MSVSSSSRARAAASAADLAAKAVARSDPTQPRATPRSVSLQIGIVGTQRQAVLGARGEHAVGLDHTLGGEVVDQHAEIGLGAVGDEIGRAPAGRQGGVDAGEQALGRRLLVAGGAVDLAGEEQAAQGTQLQVGSSSRGSMWSYSMA